ncbi:hypothetical protein FRC11_009516 [Ceratobasidium sp. 423]|nr:hypothetical protein FRC11_009516 [Ceratobasidium sp. 423]
MPAFEELEARLAALRPAPTVEPIQSKDTSSNALGLDDEMMSKLRVLGIDPKNLGDMESGHDSEASALTDNDLSGLESPLSLDLSSPTTPLRTPLTRLPDRNATLRPGDRNLFIFTQSMSSDMFDSDCAESPVPAHHPPSGRKRRTKKERDLSTSTASLSADDELDDSEEDEEDAAETLRRVRDELRLEADSEDGDTSDSLGGQVELGPPGHTPPPSRMSRRGSNTPPHTLQTPRPKLTHSPPASFSFASPVDLDKEGNELYTPPATLARDLPPIGEAEPTTPGPISSRRPLPAVDVVDTSGPENTKDDSSLEDDLASALSSDIFATPDRPTLPFPSPHTPSDDDAQVARYASLLQNLASPSRQPTDPFDDPSLNAPNKLPTLDLDSEDSKRAESVFAKLEGLHPQSGIPNVPVVTAKVPGFPKLDIEGWRAKRDDDPDSWCFMSNLMRGRTMPPPPRVPPTRSMTDEPLAVYQPGASLGAYETRQRTQLVVDGFSNLALLAILFSGVQAQFISSTSSDNSNAAARATNAVLFGGLILSVCSALLATCKISHSSSFDGGTDSQSIQKVSGRWFSILREDDSEFLSSHWLAAESRQKAAPFHEYLKFQRDAWLNKLPPQFQRDYSQSLSPDGSNGDGGPTWKSTLTGSPIQEMVEMEAGIAGRRYAYTHGLGPNPRERDVKFVIRMIDEEMEGDTTMREKIVSKILLSAVGICCGAFALFAVAIMLLVWNTQPLDVSISTTILLILNLVLMPGFFLKHRHKHVISQLSLGRAAL